MYSTTYIQDLIEDGKEAEISFRNIHNKATISCNGDNIKIPYQSLLMKYKYFLEPIVKEVALNDRDYNRYKFSPKLLSYDLYSTIEIGNSLIELNNLKSVKDFKLHVYKIYLPKDFLYKLNEIFIMEGIIK